MFIHNIFGKEEISTKAQKKGLLIGEVLRGASYGLPAIGGSTFAIKSEIKSAGGRWDGVNKVWVFPSWTDIESLVDSLSA